MDYGHEQTDKMLKKLEKKIHKEYSQAAKEVEKSMLGYLKRFEENDNEMLSKLNAGEITKKEYTEWRSKQMIINDKWKKQRDQLAEMYMNADHVASTLIKDTTYEAYALNHNFGTFEVEKGAKVDTSYTLYNKDTVAKLVKDDPQLLPPIGKSTAEKIRRGELKKWNEKQIQSVMMQGVLQGESIPKIAKRLATTVGEKNSYSHIRAARTMTTSAENAGRIDSYKRAESLGIQMKKQWLATKDSRTRHSHVLLDGESVPINEAFSNGLMFPADPDGAPAEIYNCRCTLVADFDELELQAKENIPDNFETWEDERSSEHLFTFTPATTIEEAEEYVSQYVDNSRFGALGVSYKGISVEVANEINRTLGKFYETFNVEKFGGIIAPAGNTKYGKQIQNATAAYSDIRRSFFLNRKSLKTLDTANKAFRAEHDAFTSILTHPEMYDMSKISSQLMRILENSKISGRGTIPQTIEEAMNHELGHSFEKQIKKNDLWDQARNNMSKYNIQLSGYACENESEYIAESFCSYMKGEEKIDPILEKIFDSMRR